MKPNYRTIGLVAIIFATLFTGCKLIGSNPSPPSKVESSFYDITTNLVPKLVVQTNVVEVTKEVILYRTNEVGQIVNFTNVYTVPKYDLITVTQQVEAYSLTPKASAKEAATELGGLVNLFAPGVGTVAGGIMLGLLSAWGKLRSYKKTGGVLAQNIEAIRELVKTMPDGQKYDAAIVQYLEKHQMEAGAANKVLAILEQYVDNDKARGVAVELRNAIAALK